MKKIPLLFIFSIFLIQGCLSTLTETNQNTSSHKFTRHYKNSLFKLTKNGLYSVEMVLKKGMLKKGTNELNLIVHNSKNQEVVEAEVTVQPWMPEMGHGIDIEPVIKEKGGGLYHVTNLILPMGGHWELRITISKDKITDTAIFDFPKVAASEPKKHKHIKRPEVLDTTTSQTSEKGLYRVTYVPSIQPLRTNTIHEWKVKITDSNGDPVNGARIKIEGDMPEHGHGLPTEPEVVEELPGGEYIIDGMNFQMPGWWVIKLHIHSTTGMDTVTFQLDID